MPEAFQALAALSQYGWMAITVFVVLGFVWGIVLTRGHHLEIVNLWKERLQDSQNRCNELAKENSELRQFLVISNAQATRATSVAASVIGVEHHR
jgi:hypothetical protein